MSGPVPASLLPPRPPELPLSARSSRNFPLVFPESLLPSSPPLTPPLPPPEPSLCDISGKLRPAGPSRLLKPAARRRRLTSPRSAFSPSPGVSLLVFGSNMAQIDTCLKRTFTIFNVFFAIVGGIIIALALVSQILTNVDGRESMEGRTTGLIVLYVVGAITMMIAIMGAYGAHTESKVSLIVFLVCMVIGTLLMLRTGIPTAVARPQIEGILEEKFRQLLPLDDATGDVKRTVETLQKTMHCCGLFSYEDWRTHIPDTCDCEPEVDECLQIDTYRNFVASSQTVYSKPCFPILMNYVLLFADILLGVVFTLAALAIIGMVLSSIMIHQLRHPNRPTVLLSVPAVFAPAPPKYQELHNPPAY